MAYLHCHNCGWEQDDFYTFKIKWKYIFKWEKRPFGYNPLSLILENIPWLIKPRYIEFDSFQARDRGWKKNKFFSWEFFFKIVILEEIRNFFKQRWWTFESFKKDKEKNKAFCPKCGLSNYFDMD